MRQSKVRELCVVWCVEMRCERRCEVRQEDVMGSASRFGCGAGTRSPMDRRGVGIFLGMVCESATSYQLSGGAELCMCEFENGEVPATAPG